MTAFFVPGVEPEQAEARYQELAEMIDAEAVDPGERVLSLRFVHGAEEWTATVGDPLSGQLAARTDLRPARRSSSPRSAPARRVTDPARVQAIFYRGDSYVVVTDAEPVGPVGDSTWQNPVTIPHRETRAVVRFDA